MPALPSRLAIDLSTDLLRVAEGAPGGPLRCGSGGTPAESIVGGRILDPTGVSGALKQLLARTEIREGRALIAVSDANATFRLLKLPPAATDANVDSAVARELAFDPEQMAVKWVDVRATDDCRLIYATAWPREMVKAVTEVIRGAGLTPTAIDLKSACVARVVRQPACIIVDMSAAPVELFLIDQQAPQLWRSLTLDPAAGEDLVAALAPELGAVIRFAGRRRDSQFGPGSPILIASDQAPSSQVLGRLASALEHPVALMPAPARVPDVRYATFLTCLGLLMRRT